MYSRMADKLSKGSNSSAFKTVSIDIGVIGKQGKTAETRKTAILTAKNNNKKHQINSQFEKNLNSTEMSKFACLLD